MTIVGKYQPLSDYLLGCGLEEIAISFPQLEKLLERSLPESAYKSRSWWSNRKSGGFQAQAWLGAEYQVIAVDLDRKRVIFRKQTARPKAKSASGTAIWDSTMIEALRRHMKLNQSQFAEELGVRQQTVSEWENGIYTPKRSMVKLLTMIADREGFQYK